MKLKETDSSFICPLCHTPYETSNERDDCYHSHKKFKGEVYNIEYQANTLYPKITLRFEDGSIITFVAEETKGGK
jgi:hypothetical protein